MEGQIIIRKKGIDIKELPLATSGDGLYKVEHSDGPEHWQEAEYRYAGVDPNNYVIFNDEIWRIIGLVNVKTKDETYEQRLKIVRTDGVIDQEDFGSYPWDSGNSNDWTKASLKKLLNGDYYNNQGENKFPKGLDATAREMVDGEVTWNLGGTANYNNTTVTQFYNYERGTTVYNESRPTEWTLNDDAAEHKGVGLIYPSDYGYATNGGSEGRNFCFSETLYNWGTRYYVTYCAKNDWLKPSSSFLWTITPYSLDAYHVFYVYGPSGYVTDGIFVNTSSAVWPVVYLKSSVKIIDGTGEIGSPYTLSVQS